MENRFTSTAELNIVMFVPQVFTHVKGFIETELSPATTKIDRLPSSPKKNLKVVGEVENGLLAVYKDEVNTNTILDYTTDRKHIAKLQPFDGEQVNGVPVVRTSPSVSIYLAESVVKAMIVLVGSVIKVGVF